MYLRVEGDIKYIYANGLPTKKIMKKSSRMAKTVAFKSWSQLPAISLEEDRKLSKEVQNKKGSDSE